MPSAATQPSDIMADVPHVNLSMRLPRWAHKQMKAEAKAAGRTAADLCGRR